MTDPLPSTPPDPCGLQFDRAEPARADTAALACEACKEPIAAEYWTIQGKTFCAGCRSRFVSALSGSGGGGRRFVKAALLGVLGGAAGAAVWFAVAALLNLIVGFVAILVGYLVGAGVRKGAEYRGGLLYQVMAVVITYVSICGTLVPLALVEGVGKTEGHEEPAKPTVTEAPAPPKGGGDKPPSEAPPKLPGSLPALLSMLVLLSLALPFMGAFDILTWAIVAFGLWEAWKMNRKVSVEFQGPFRVSAEKPAGA